LENQERAIRRQLNANQSANILYPSAPELLKVDSSFVESLENAKNESLSNEDLTRMVDFAVSQCITRILEVNQYLQISEDAQQRLAEIYRQTWEKITKTEDIETVLRTSHYPAIRVWLTNLYPASLAKSLLNQPKIRSLCCAEYSPELQFQMLRIGLHDIQEPVLDIGCGYSATLTKYLKSHNIEVIGFDRFVEEPTDFIKECDWVNFDYSSKSWGTIISHMALSNHYRYALQYDKPMQSAIDSIFPEILKSLRAGGCFVFAPGIHELEQKANTAEFQVESIQVMPGLTSTKIIRKR